MALWELVRALVRRWPVVLIGMIATAGAGLFLTRSEVVYFTQGQAVFLAPSSSRYPNSLQTRSEDLIITAGLVAKRINGPGRELKHSDTSVNILGVPGGHHGYWIRLPDSGGQWATHFQEQLLLVDAAAPTPEEARSLQLEAFGRIENELALMQDEAEVAAVNRISVIHAPGSTVIYEVRGSRVRALAMTAVLGGAATLAVIVLMEARQRRLASRRAAQGEGPAAGRAGSSETAVRPVP